MTFLVAPPPPPPPPPPPAAAPVKVVKQIQTDIINGQLRTPTKIPEKVQMIKEEEAPPPVTSWPESWVASRAACRAGRWVA